MDELVTLVLLIGGGIFLVGFFIGHARGRSSATQAITDSRLNDALLKLERIQSLLEATSSPSQWKRPYGDETTSSTSDNEALSFSQPLRSWNRTENSASASYTSLPETHAPEVIPAPEPEAIPEQPPLAAMAENTPSPVAVSQSLQTETTDETTEGNTSWFAHDKNASDDSSPAALAETETTPEPPARSPFNSFSWGDLNRVARFLGMDNLWVLGGVAILFLGLVFLVRLAADHGIFTPPLRLAAAALVGCGLLAFGWKLKERRRTLALILQGGGVGALYLTVVAAVQLYGLLPSLAAFIILVCLVAFSTFLAIVQNAQIMAHVAKGAGFLAPLLVSSGSGNYIGLFSYYIILNLGIVAVSCYRPWRRLHLTGFICTVLIGGLWGGSAYDQATMFATVEVFLLAFFILFTYLALSGSAVFQSARLRPFADTRPEAAVDLPLTLGTPLIFLLYQAWLAQGIPFVLAFSALGLGALYLWIAASLWKRRTARMPDEDTAESTKTLADKVYGLLAEIYLAFGIIGLNLALPLALFDLEIPDLRNRLLGLAWSLEGAALYWLGQKNGIRLFRLFGGVGFFLAAMFQISSLENLNASPSSYGGLTVVMALHLMGACAFASAALACHRFAASSSIAADTRRSISWSFLGMALLWLYGSWFSELSSIDHTLALMTLGTMIVAAIAVSLTERLKWPDLRFAPLIVYPPLALLAGIGLLCLIANYNFLLFGGNIFVDTLDNIIAGSIVDTSLWRNGTILLFIGFEIFLLYRDKSNNTLTITRQSVLPTLAVIALNSLTTYSMRFLPQDSFLAPSLFLAATLLWPVLCVALLLAQATPYTLPPTTPRCRAARLLARAPLPLPFWLGAGAVPILCVGIWFLACFFEKGNIQPPYIPLFNYIEFGLVVSLACLFFWWQTLLSCLPSAKAERLHHPIVWYALIFLMLNISLARACAFWGGMEFSLSGALRDPIFQAALALFWGIGGISAMILGNKKGWRLLWLAGMSLMLLDIAKLFFIDLTRMETVWRIVAFMGVGLLLILVGGYAPLPTAHKTTEDETQESEEEK